MLPRRVQFPTRPSHPATLTFREAWPITFAENVRPTSGVRNRKAAGSPPAGIFNGRSARNRNVRHGEPFWGTPKTIAVRDGVMR
jgi:hypothetical protein